MRIDRAVKRYGALTALDVAGLSFPRGEICAVMGTNGSGKTTLGRVLAGTLMPDEGACILDAGDRVGYMPQRSFAFYGTLSRNVALGSPDGRYSERCASLVQALGLESLVHTKAKKLSGGETARMAFARVLAGQWSYLVLDEPTAALDIPSTLAAERLIRTYREESNAGVILVTHSVNQARRLADRVLFMAGGSVVEDGSLPETFSDPHTAELREFLDILGG